MLLEEKNPILTVRLPDGSTQSIIALQGTSAYEMARSQGYEGTEVEFRDALARVTGAFDWVWNGGKESGPSPILYFGQNEYSFSPIPTASSTASGIVTTTAQSLAGEKTFTEGIFLPTLHASRIRGEGNTSQYWNSYEFSLLSVDSKDNQYRPLISTRTSAGGNWTLVNYNNENLMFVYTDSEQCEGTTESPGGSNNKGKRTIINFTPEGGLIAPGLITGNGGLATTTGTFSSTITATGKITGNGGLATTTISASGASTLKALSATSGTFSSTITATGKITGNGGLATTTISASGASTLKALSATTGTFSNNVTVSGNIQTTGNNRGHYVVNTAGDQQIGIHMGNGTNRGLFDSGTKGLKNSKKESTWVFYMDSDNNINLQTYRYMKFTPMYSTSTDDRAGFYPTNKYCNLGGSSHPWYDIHYSHAYTKSTWGSCDKRLKDVQDNSILNIDLCIYDDLEPVVFKYKNLTETDDYSRTHIGFMAQDVENLIYKHGLDNEECALIAIEPLDEPTETCPDGQEYYLNYTELHGLHTLKNHQQDARIKNLEEKNQQLENIIADLKTQLELIKLAIGG